MSGKKPYKYSKRVISQRNKPWQQDEVTAEIQQKIKNGERARPVSDTTLSKVAKAEPRFRPSKRYKGGKTKIQLLAETIAIPDELPELPDYLRTFAFRYATEMRKHFDWANVFHVSPYTIRNWLLKPEVMQYILKIRQERQALMVERMSELEKKAYEKLDELLSMPVNEDTAEVMRKAIIDVLTLRRGEVPGEKGASVYVNQNQSQQQGQVTLTKVEAQMSVEEMKAQIEELEMIDEVLDDRQD